MASPSSPDNMTNPAYGQMPENKKKFDKTKWVLLGYKYMVYGINTAIIIAFLGVIGVFIYGLILSIQS